MYIHPHTCAHIAENQKAHLYTYCTNIHPIHMHIPHRHTTHTAYAHIHTYTHTTCMHILYMETHIDTHPTHMHSSRQIHRHTHKHSLPACIPYIQRHTDTERETQTPHMYVCWVCRGGHIHEPGRGRSQTQAIVLGDKGLSFKPPNKDIHTFQLSKGNGSPMSDLLYCTQVLVPTVLTAFEVFLLKRGVEV